MCVLLYIEKKSWKKKWCSYEISAPVQIKKV